MNTRAEAVAVALDTLLEVGIVVCMKHEPALEITPSWTGWTTERWATRGAVVRTFVCRHCRCVYSPDGP